MRRFPSYVDPDFDPFGYGRTVRDNEEIPKNIKFALLTLLTFYGPNHPIRPSVSKLAKACCVSDRQMKRTLSEAEDLGWLRRTFRRNRTTRYLLIVPPKGGVSSVTQTDEQVTPMTPGGDTHVTSGNASGVTHVTQTDEQVTPMSPQEVTPMSPDQSFDQSLALGRPPSARAALGVPAHTCEAPWLEEVRQGVELAAAASGVVFPDWSATETKTAALLSPLTQIEKNELWSRLADAASSTGHVRSTWGLVKSLVAQVIGDRGRTPRSRTGHSSEASVGGHEHRPAPTPAEQDLRRAWLALPLKLPECPDGGDAHDARLANLWRSARAEVRAACDWIAVEVWQGSVSMAAVQRCFGGNEEAPDAEREAWLSFERELDAALRLHRRDVLFEDFASEPRQEGVA